MRLASTATPMLRLPVAARRLGAKVERTSAHSFVIKYPHAGVSDDATGNGHAVAAAVEQLLGADFVVEYPVAQRWPVRVRTAQAEVLCRFEDARRGLILALYDMSEDAAVLDVRNLCHTADAVYAAAADLGLVPTAGYEVAEHGELAAGTVRDQLAVALESRAEDTEELDHWLGQLDAALSDDQIDLEALAAATHDPASAGRADTAMVAADLLRGAFRRPPPAATPAQLAALGSFLATLDGAQRAALLDVLGSHVENVESSLDDKQPAGHAFVVAVRDAVAASIAA